jgi:hypothetical protein
MPWAGGAYLFLLGLAAGIALLSLTAYRHVSPAWLRRLLLAAGLFVFSRYVTMALFTIPATPTALALLRPCWFATSVGLTLPSVFAVDQLLRHPAMTPKRLLRWYAPFLAAYLAVLLFGRVSAEPDRVAGWSLHLTPVWQLLLSVTHTAFVLAFLGVCVSLMRKVPQRPIRVALAGLAAAYVYLTVDGLVLALGGWYFRPYLYSEMLALLALWHAFETATALQRQSVSL